MFWSGFPLDLLLCTMILIISNEDVKIMNIVKSFEESGLLIQGISETIQIKVKEQKEGFLSMLLGTLGVSRKIISR